MFGSDYLLGYSQGRHSADDEREASALVSRVIYRQRSVQVDQSYLDQLAALIEGFRSDSDHNLGKAAQFHGEALRWKEKALRFEAEAKALRDQTSALQAQNAKYDAALVKSLADHVKTTQEKHGLNYFRWMTTRLIKAHIDGRADRPEFLELRTVAKAISNAIERGEPFSGFEDKPDEKARVQALVDALLVP
jgi:hypothetical protein